MKKYFNSQRGFTLIELTVGIMISCILGAGIGAAAYQINRINDTNSARVTAIKQVENALHFMIRDVQMAQNPAVGTESSFPLTLSWKTWEDNVQHQVVYNLDDDGNLTRNNGTSISVVAKYIDSDTNNTNWTYDSSAHKMTIVITSTAQAGQRQYSQTRKVEIVPRVGS